MVLERAFGHFIMVSTVNIAGDDVGVIAMSEEVKTFSRKRTKGTMQFVSCVPGTCTRRFCNCSVLRRMKYKGRCIRDEMSCFQRPLL